MMKRTRCCVCARANARPRVLLASQLMLPIKPDIHASRECRTILDGEDGRRQSIVWVPSSPLAELQVSLFDFSLTLHGLAEGTEPSALSAFIGLDRESDMAQSNSFSLGCLRVCCVA